MAHEGRGDIDQEKKGRPGHQTDCGQRAPHAANNLTTDQAEAATGRAVQCVTSVDRPKERYMRMDNNREEERNGCLSSASRMKI